jgi:probable rRNA maturation factor
LNPPNNQINFFTEDIDFVLKSKTILRAWVRDSVVEEGYTISVLNFIFCSDAFLLKINIDYLKHNFLTDIITFDTGDGIINKIISGDLFISIDRIKANAFSLNKLFSDELHRVMIHGVLHLMDYKDKRKIDKFKMTEREDFYLLALKL